MAMPTDATVGKISGTGYQNGVALSAGHGHAIDGTTLRRAEPGADVEAPFHVSAPQPGDAAREASATGGESCTEVLILTQHFWPVPIGIAAYAGDFARWLDQSKIDVEVVSDRPYYPSHEILQPYRNGARDRELFFGVKVRRLPTYVPKGGGAFKRLMNETGYLCGLIGNILSGSIAKRSHVVSICPSILTIIGGHLAKKRGGRHVAVIYDVQSGLAGSLGMIPSQLLVRALTWVEKRCMSLVDGIIVISDKMKQVLVDQGIKCPITVIPIWADMNKIFPLPFLSSETPTVLYSGNMGRKQALDQAITLAEHLAALKASVRIVLRGDGTLREWLEAEITAKGLSNIAVESLVPDDKLNQALSEAHIHLIPQDPRGADYAVPSKIYNILAAGRPIVCTALDGSPLWQLSQQTQAIVCVPPNRPDLLANKIIELIGDTKTLEHMGSQGREYVCEHAEREKVLLSYLRVVAGSRGSAM
jgi:colanic acid biosynthesis glycosyl transferase WcaI